MPSEMQDGERLINFFPESAQIASTTPDANRSQYASWNRRLFPVISEYHIVNARRQPCIAANGKQTQAVSFHSTLMAHGRSLVPRGANSSFCGTVMVGVSISTKSFRSSHLIMIIEPNKYKQIQTSAEAHPKMPTLKQNLEDLPAELYDLIYNFTFTPSSSDFHISGSYNPPANLQVDRRTRQLATKRYYHLDAIFWCTNHEHCVHWLTSLSEETLELLHEVRCEPLSTFWVLDTSSYFAKSQRTRVHCQLLQRGIMVQPSILRFRMRCKCGGPVGDWSEKA